VDLLFQEMKQYLLHFLDLGCSGALDQKWAELFPFLSYTGFDPNLEECKRLASQPHPFKEARYLPYAVHKDKGTYVMHKTESIYCYSLLPPNHPWLDRFSFSDLFTETGAEPVLCTTLDHLAREEGLKADIMKLDTQGLELPILQSGNEILSNAICVETETGFMENYIGETTYAQIDEFMRSKGFLMFDLSIHQVGRKNFLSEHGKHQPIWCESLWLFDFIGQKRKPPREQAIKALTICRALGYPDYGFELAAYFNHLGVLNSDELASLSKAEDWEIQHEMLNGPGGQAKVIEDLTRRLQESEADRAARLAVIRKYEVAMSETTRRLEESEADRAARLEVIGQYDLQLRETVQRVNLSNSVLPKISIITPSFNQGVFIERTIRSVIDQGYPNLEYIIIDGGSTDGTLEVIKRYESHLSYWISEPVKGQAEALNKGFSKATGDVVTWLNSGDTYAEGALWKWAKTGFQYSGADLWMASHHTCIDKDDRIVGVSENAFPNHSQLVQYWRMGGRRIHQPSVFFRRRLLEEAGTMDPRLRYGFDYDFFLRLSRAGRMTMVHGNWVDCRLPHQQGSGNPVEGEPGKFIREWHLSSKRQWGKPWEPRWWRFFISFQFCRPFFSWGQTTSDFISKRQMVFKWLYLWPGYLWSLMNGRGPLPRW